MHGGVHAFNDLVGEPLIRYGGEYKAPARSHNMLNVYGEMLLQICHSYPGLPDARSLSLTEIRFFYRGLEKELKVLSGS